jgi:hypothetical protein
VRRPAAAVLAALVLAPAAAAEDSIAVRAALNPRAHLFGDPVTAEVEVVVDSRAAGGVRVRPDFHPYAVVGSVRVTRTEGGGSTELRYRYTLDCLERACLPGEARRRIVFSPVHVRVRIAGSPREATATWPTLIVRSRLAPEDVSRRRLRSSVYPVGEVSYRVSPGLLFWSLAGASAALTLAGLALVGSLFGGVRLTWQRDRFARLGPVERALVLVRLSARRGDAGRRRQALERLGHELEARGRPELGDEACRLAWAEAAPDGDALIAFACLLYNLTLPTTERV